MKKLIVLTGAGISAESGLKTFRDSNGLWENYKIEDVATPQAWRKNAVLVQEFYNLRRKEIIQAIPNDAHFYLAALQKRYDVEIITQNIDDLHERAGSKKVLHLHGNIRYAKSSGPGQEKKYYLIESDAIAMGDLCDDGHQLRPHVVWFGEDVPLLNTAAEICADADLLLIIGTSLQVYPAAGLIHAVRKLCRKIVIDPGATQLGLDASFTQIQATAVEGIKELDKLI